VVLGRVERPCRAGVLLFRRMAVFPPRHVRRGSLSSAPAVEPKHDPEKRQKHATLGVVFLTIFVSMVGFGIVIPVLPDYAAKEPFRLDPTSLGWLTGIFSLVQLFTAPLLGKISDRVGRRPVLLISIIGTAIGYFITGAAGVWWMLFLGRIIDGASGGNIAAAQAAVADVTKPEDRSKAMGMIGAAFGLGFVLGPAIGGLLSIWHHAAPFYFAGILALINAVLVWKMMPETLTEENRLHPAQAAPLAEVFHGGRGGFIGALLLAVLTSTTGFAFVHLLFSLFCADHLGYSRAQMSYAFHRHRGSDRAGWVATAPAQAGHREATGGDWFAAPCGELVAAAAGEWHGAVSRGIGAAGAG
jgi:multidrug resistance protein